MEVITVQEMRSTKKAAAVGRKIVKEMLRGAAILDREPIPLSELVLGTECGRSDYRDLLV